MENQTIWFTAEIVLLLHDNRFIIIIIFQYLKVCLTNHIRGMGIWN